MGAAVAVVILLPVAMIGLAVGPIIILARLQLDFAPPDRPASLVTTRPVSLALLAWGVHGGSALCLLSGLAIFWPALRGLNGEAFARLESFAPLGRILTNTLLPQLLRVYLFQLPIT